MLVLLLLSACELRNYPRSQDDSLTAADVLVVHAAPSILMGKHAPRDCGGGAFYSRGRFRAGNVAFFASIVTHRDDDGDCSEYRNVRRVAFVGAGGGEYRIEVLLPTGSDPLTAVMKQQESGYRVRDVRSGNIVAIVR
ncbi:MAG: hypothetical protein AAF515_04110 [Pseudomonadota bacterium]